jgi:cyanate lyase
MEKDTTMERGLRRRLLTVALGLTPADIKAATGLHSVTVSNVLSGSARLRTEQAASVGKMIARRARELFAA